MTLPEQTSNRCPCGSGFSLGRCCGALIQGLSAPQTALQLMRSRYSAHVLLAVDYLWYSWSELTRHRTSPEAIHDWASSCDWLGLEILDHHLGGPHDTEGTVTFAASYRQGAQLHRHLEKSRFVRAAGLWRYLDHCA